MIGLMEQNEFNAKTGKVAAFLERVAEADYAARSLAYAKGVLDEGRAVVKFGPHVSLPAPKEIADQLLCAATAEREKDHREAMCILERIVAIIDGSGA